MGSKNIIHIFLIFLIALVLRLIYLSPWLEDWDSVQFALALHNFSIVDHQPHPPGYPLYVFLGKVVNLFFNNDNLSLTTLSAILGSATAIPFYFLLRQMVQKWLALIAAIILLFVPLHWTLSEVALSLVPGTFFTTVTALLLYYGLKSQKYLLAGSFLAGISIGVRFAEFSIVIALLALVLLLRKNWQDFVKTSLLFLLGVIVWFIPLIILTGWNEYFYSFTTHAEYIIEHDSFFSQKITFLQRLLFIWNLILKGYSIYFVPLIILGILQIKKLIKNPKDFDIQFTLIWLFSYLLPLIFIYNFELQRYTLPLLPPILVLSAVAIGRMKKELVILFYIIIGFGIFWNSIQQVQKIHSQIPPTIAPVLYIKENFDPKKTLLITTFTYRQFQYYAKDFQNFYGAKNSPNNISSEIVIIDYLPLKDQILSLSKYYVYQTKKFSGPELIFPRVSETTLVVLKKNENKND